MDRFHADGTQPSVPQLLVRNRVVMLAPRAYLSVDSADYRCNICNAAPADRIYTRQLRQISGGLKLTVSVRCCFLCGKSRAPHMRIQLAFVAAGGDA